MESETPKELERIVEVYKAIPRQIRTLNYEDVHVACTHFEKSPYFENYDGIPLEVKQYNELIEESQEFDLSHLENGLGNLIVGGGVIAGGLALAGSNLANIITTYPEFDSKFLIGVLGGAVLSLMSGSFLLEAPYINKQKKRKEKEILKGLKKAPWIYEQSTFWNKIFETGNSLGFKYQEVDEDIKNWAVHANNRVAKTIESNSQCAIGIKCFLDERLEKLRLSQYH